MSVFKIEKNKDYTIMSNYHLKNRNLSYKAKGLLSFMLSLPDDWDYSVKGLVAISKESIKAIQAILKELEKNGYLVRNRINNSSGKFEYDYLIYEQPYSQKRCTVKGCTVKEHQINTNKQIDKNDKIETSLFFNEEHNKLTVELVKKGYITEEDSQIFYYDKFFDKLLDENKNYTSLLIIIHYIISRIIEKDFKDEDGNVISNKFGYLKNSILSNINKLNNYKDNLWDEIQ